MNKETYMQSADALGTTVELRLVAPSVTIAEKWFGVLWKEIADFENRFSRFKPESELCQFNSRAGEKVEISDEFKALIETAQRFSVLSGGLFNPFVLPGLQRAGYIHSLDGVGAQSPDYSKREVADYTSLKIEGDYASIPANTALDMGGIGKGYLADHLGKLLDGEIKDYCLSLGGDIAIKGRDKDGQWNVDVQSAKDRLKDKASFTGRQDAFGIATSGITREKNGRVQVHLIDPKTGAPVPTSFDIVTVVADDATTADVMASCVLIAGRDLALRLIEQHTIKAVLLQDREQASPFVIGEGFSLIGEEPVFHL